MPIRLNRAGSAAVNAVNAVNTEVLLEQLSKLWRLCHAKRVHQALACLLWDSISFDKPALHQAFDKPTNGRRIVSVYFCDLLGR